MQLHIGSVLQCLESCIFRQLRERMVRKRAQALSVCFLEYWMCTIPLPYGVVIRKLDRTLYEHTHTTDKAKWFFILQSLYASTNTSHSIQSRPLYL